MFRFVSVIKPMSRLPQWRAFSTPNFRSLTPYEDHRNSSYNTRYYEMFLMGVAALCNVTIVLLLLSNKQDMTSININFSKIEAYLAKAETREERFMTQFATMDLRMKESELTCQAIKKEVEAVKEEIVGMKEEIGGLKEEIGGIKGEIGGLKLEIGGIKGEIHGLSSRMDTMTTLIYDVLKEMKDVNNKK